MEMCGVVWGGGAMLIFINMVYKLVRYASPSGPICLGCMMLILSGPVELLFLLCFIAFWTSVVENVITLVCIWCVFLSICLFVLRV